MSDAAKLDRINALLAHRDDRDAILGNWMADLWEELQEFSPLKWDKLSEILRGPRERWEAYVRDAARIANQHYKALHDVSATADLSTEEGREAMRQANLLRHTTQSWPFALVGQYDDFVSQWAKAMSYNFLGSHIEVDRQAEESEVKKRALDQLMSKLRPH